jgi:hypothetical protein
MIKQANASVIGWIRFLEILEMEGFLNTGAILLAPGHNVIELSRTIMNQLNWLWTLRNAFAHNILLCYGNDIIISHSDLMEYYVLQRIELLYKQLSSSLKRKDMIRLQNQIHLLSKRWGVTVKSDRLDIIFIGNELVSHPLIRYLNLRNNIIFDKIEQYHEITKDSLFSTENILALQSYIQEEFIPSLTLDTFFVKDINEVKHRIRNSVFTKTINQLMNSINNL